MQTTFYFVRHATPNFHNHDDMARELTEQGMADRLRVTDYLMDKHIDIVLSSPYKRAVDTIAHFAEAKGLVIKCVDGFRERAVGTWVDAFEGFAQRQWADFSFKLDGGECLNEVQARNVRALFSALREFPGKSIAVGSHGTALSALINHFDPSFGFDEFMKIRCVMPWIVRLTFGGETLCEIDTEWGRRRVLPMSALLAAEISAWRYPPPYDFYNPESPADFLNGEYCAYMEDGALTGFFCFGADARIKTAQEDAYSQKALDIGLGMRPDKTGRGGGPAFVRAGIAHAEKAFPGMPLRLTVADFNRRAIRVYERAGFRAVCGVTQVGTGTAFTIMRRDV